MHKDDCKRTFVQTSFKGYARHEKNARPFHVSWAFLIALDGGNKSDTSYLDVRICVVSGNGVLSNLHLMAIPMRERHTRERMCDLASRVLDNLVPDWRCRMVSITTDGAASMTDQYRGVASRFGNATLPGFYRVWCTLHQLDLVLQRANL